ncbi:MAG: hypothetical protein ABWY48_04965 [Pseudoxanthomonas sp.]
MMKSRSMLTRCAGLSLACLSMVVCVAAAAAQDSGAPAATAPRPGQCGYLSTRQGVVPESENVFPANITQIDGRSTSFMRANRQKVAAGTHKLTVSENIEERRLTEAQLVQIRKMQRFAYARAYKHLEVDVQPGTTYRIGALLHPDKLDTASIKANAYWEPVVWEQVAEKCP